MHNIGSFLQPIGAVIAIYAIFAFLWDRHNPFLIYLFPAALFLLGLSLVLDF